MGNATVVWLVIATILTVATFGVLNILYVILYLGCFLGGSIAILYEYCQKEVKKQKTYFNSPINTQNALVKTGIETVLEVELPKVADNVDRDLTGSVDVDNQIHKCLDYLMRDYVKYWYNDLSDDPSFLHHFRILLQHCIKNISRRCQSFEWQPFLSTVLVDQFASHVRLFQKAKQQVDNVNSELILGEVISSGANTPISGDGQCSSDTTETKDKLLDFYFDSEVGTDNLCRDLFSCDSKKQLCYFQDIAELLLYIVLPEKDFHCKPLLYLLRETMVQGMFFPTFKLYSNSDYLNQYICWTISDNCVSSEWFLTVLRHTQTVAELGAVRDKAEEEIERITSKDGVGDDPVIKQQLSSMRYVLNICQRRIYKHQEEGTIGFSEFDGENAAFVQSKYFNLPLSAVLRNNIALQIFIEYMQSVGGQAYLFFWLTVDGYRASAEQQINEVKDKQLKGSLNGAPDMEMLRTIGHNIYEQYLSKHADPRVPLDPNAEKQLKKRLDSGEPSPFVFDDIQLKVFNIMQKEERFFPEFKTSPYYVRMLAELDLLQESSLTSADTNESLISAASSQDDPALVGIEDESSRLSAVITRTGRCTEHGKTYALYAITVTRHYSSGKEESWSTFRRYREFHDLHCSLKENDSNLGNLKLPGKTFFKDLKEDFLERRRVELNSYLHALLTMTHPPKAMDCLHTFLDAKAYERNARSLAKKVDTMMRTSVRSVTNFVSQAPDNFIDGIQKASDKVSDGLQKIKLPTSDKRDPNVKLHEQIEYNIDNNLPIGILLLLMDDIFDLRHKNQWLRRQIVAAIQQLLRTLFGERMNRKIIDYVENALSAQQVALYVEKFSDNFWPTGILADEMPPREDPVVMRTRVLAKTKMHGVIPDELRTIVGNETCRRGMVHLFELAQYEELNMRFCCVLLEGILKKIFPSNKFEDVFKNFHSQSPRVRAFKRKKVSVADEKQKSFSTSTRSLRKQLTTD